MSPEVPGVAAGTPTESPFGAAPGVFPGLSPAPSATRAAPRQQPAATPATPGEAGAQTEEPTAPEQAPANPPAVAPPAVPNPPPPLLAPQYGFGTLQPQQFGGLGNFVPAAPPAPPEGTALGAIQPGALPVQAGNLRAPPILVLPHASLVTGYTDNPRNTSKTLSDVYGDLRGGTTISVDSVRFQGQLSGDADYRRYARATDLNTLNANLLGYGLGTIVRDHLYIDGRAAITQLSPVGGFGFANSTLIPASQQTQTTVLSLTPIARESVGGYVDGEFRYNYGLTAFHNGSLLNNTASPAPGTSLSDTTQNEATLTLATGSRINVIGSRLTFDWAQTDSTSLSKSTQLLATDDLQYQFNRTFAALARFGYEDISYPRQPAASTKGAVWSIGARVTPSADNSLVLNYGHQFGSEGLTGQLRYQLTPLTSIQASLDRGLGSTQQQILNNLNTSSVNANGTVVNSVTGVPTALVNPQFGATGTEIFSFQNARAGVQSSQGRNTFGVFGFVDQRTAHGNTTGTPTGSGSNTAIGANFSWGRSLTPRLSGGASLGYAREMTNHQKTLTSSLNLSYVISDRLNATASYQFINVNAAAVNGSYTRNQIEFGVTGHF